MLSIQAQENGVALDEEQLLFLVDDYDAFDYNVDEAPTTQTMFMVNLSFANPVYDEDGSLYDSDILSENVQGRLNQSQGNNPQGGGADGYEGAHNRVGNANPGHARQIKCYNYNGIGNIARKCTPLKHLQNFDYFKDKMLLMQAQENGVALDEELLLFLADDWDEFDSDVDEAPMAQTMFMANLSSADPVYDEASPSFELTEREQKINEKLRIVITDRNFKEETLKTELHSVKLQLASTINHNKLMVEEVTSLKKDFKQKENKYLEDFLDMKSLKEKAEDRLFKQDQSLQIVHMLCRPKPYYNELNKVAIGYKNPLCLTCAKQVQPALYNGHEIIKDNHVPSIVHNTKDTLEIAEITRRKMNDKIKDPKCVNHKVKIVPHDYLKENFLVSFAPQKQLTPKRIFWSQYLIKMKTEALKDHTTTSRPIKALTIYPLNTPAMLVLRMLPTKSQVKIHIFTLIQLFLEFDKTCKKRITPTGLTEGEMGFEQTKECYLKEARCLELEAELSNLCDKSHNDNHNELVNWFSNLEKNASFPSRKGQRHQTIEKPNLSLAREPNNKEAYLDYLRHFKERVETIHEIVEEAKVVRPLDSSIVSACRYTKHSQELLEYAIGTCP
nr:hypothetical protein [Tanacetum cinerariifolium]